MRLTDITEKIKTLLVFDGDLPKDVFLITLILLSGLGGFLVGRISEETPFAGEKQPLQIVSSSPAAVFKAQGEKTSARASSLGTMQASSVSGKEDPEGVRSFVASKNGTAFYLPTCSGANRIREENKIWFASKAEAIGMGYKPAANCKGL